MILHARDDVGEIREWVDPARLARRDERVQPGDAHARVDVPDEEIVLPTERDPTERALGRVVVERHACVVEEAPEFAPLVQRVSDRRRDRTLWRVSWLLLAQPRVQLIPNRSGTPPSKPEVRLRPADLLLLRVMLDSIEAEDQIDRLLRDRRRRQRVVKVASQVRVMSGTA